MHLDILKVMSKWNLYIMFCIFQVVCCFVYEILCGCRLVWCTHHYPHCFDNKHRGGGVTDATDATGLAVS
jgi:hypothetical protein